jgi:hypothetical protein
MKQRVKINRTQGSEFVPSGINAYKEYLVSRLPLNNIVPRSMMMLDSDMAIAMKKMMQAQKLETQLPGMTAGLVAHPRAGPWPKILPKVMPPCRIALCAESDDEKR